MVSRGQTEPEKLLVSLPLKLCLEVEVIGRRFSWSPSRAIAETIRSVLDAPAEHQKSLLAQIARKVKRPDSRQMEIVHETVKHLMVELPAETRLALMDLAQVQDTTVQILVRLLLEVAVEHPELIRPS